MKSPRQWSIRQMFVWVFVAALISSQVSHLYRKTFIGLDDFTISHAQLREWISKIDRLARTDVRGGRSGQSGDEVDSEFEYRISSP